MINIPTKKEGLTGEKAAHLLLDRGFYIFGIPSVLYSDRGPQFSGAFFRNLCARLGIRQGFSQAKRPQGNGRVEVAGKRIKDILRQMHAEEGINWMEALPRATMLYNTTPYGNSPSPFTTLFGRN